MSVPPTPARLYRGRVADQILTGALPDGSRLPAERELAARYDVSAPTVREAIRVLTAMGLVNTRNGSRTTVTAQADTMLAMSIASLVQVEKAGAREVLGLLGVLNAYAAELAAQNASDEEAALLRQAAEDSADKGGIEQNGAALRHFFVTLAEISHNPVLAGLIRFLTEVQIGTAVQLSSRDTTGESGWAQVAGALQPARLRIADTVAAREPARAAQLMHEYHRDAIDRIRAVRDADRRPDGPESALNDALTAWLRANVGVGGQAAHPPLSAHT
jgi:DNA-binding FadR family transcriptional regulator